MAIYRTGVLVTGISGNLGSVNFANSQRGNVVRVRAVRTNPQTAPQLAIRRAYNQLWHLWQDLGPAGQTAWRQAALQFPRTNRLGLQRTLSGWQLFFETNQHIVASTTADLTDFLPLPPPLNAAPALTDITLSLIAGINPSFSVTSSIPIPALDHPPQLTIFAVRPHTTLIKRSYHGWRRLVRKPFLKPTIEFRDDFLDIFGPPADGEALSFRFALINDEQTIADQPDLLTRPSPQVSLTQLVGPAPVDPLVPDAESYDGVTQWAARASDFDGNVDTKFLTLSLWFRRNGGPTLNQGIIAGAGQRYIFRFDASNRFNILIRNPAAATAYALRSSTAFLADGIWKNLILTIESDTQRLQLRLDDAVDTLVEDTVTTGETFDWTLASHFLANRADLSTPLDACLSQVYFNTAAAIDLDIEANRRLFITAALDPVDLGPFGGIPTGTPPLIFLPGGDGATNTGTGGPYVPVGAPGPCVDTP